MTTTMRTEWIKTLQVGDSVAIVENSMVSCKKYSAGIITKITPTGQIEVNGDKTKFNNRGYITGDTYKATKFITQLTTEVEDTIFRDSFKDQLITMLIESKFKKVPTEKLREIKKILER